MEDRKPQGLKKQLLGYAGIITLLSWAGTLGCWIGTRGVEPVAGSPAAKLAATGLPEVIQFIIVATAMSVALILICVLLMVGISVFILPILYILEKIDNLRRK